MDSEDDRLAFEGEQVFRDGEGGSLSFQALELLEEEFKPPALQEYIDYLEQILVENRRLRGEVERLDRQVSGVQALGRLNAKLTEEGDALAEALREVLASATPNPAEHPTMAAAWEHGEAALVRAGRTPNDVTRGTVDDDQ